MLHPNDEGTDQQYVPRRRRGRRRLGESSAYGALRNPYVVQEVMEPVVDLFPVLQYGHLEMQKMRMDVHPHSYLGKVQGCSSWLTAVGPSGFSTLSGVAPTFHSGIEIARRAGQGVWPFSTTRTFTPDVIESGGLRITESLGLRPETTSTSAP